MQKLQFEVETYFTSDLAHDYGTPGGVIGKENGVISFHGNAHKMRKIFNA